MHVVRYATSKLCIDYARSTITDDNATAAASGMQ